MANTFYFWQTVSKKAKWQPCHRPPVSSRLGIYYSTIFETVNSGRSKMRGQDNEKICLDDLFSGSHKEQKCDKKRGAR